MAIIVGAYYLAIILALILLRGVNPPFTAVQVERRLAAWIQRRPYKRRYLFVPLPRISSNLQHAVIAAEDARFFHHHGFDWKEIQTAVYEDVEGGRERGASTITQQLVRNLFLSTDHSIIRKGVEFSLVPFAEAILPKRRILELYLNVIEWGPGIYGAEAASRFYFEVPTSRLSREQAIDLAEVLPAPRRWKPGREPRYGAHIIERMNEMGW